MGSMTSDHDVMHMIILSAAEGADWPQQEQQQQKQVTRCITGSRGFLTGLTASETVESDDCLTEASGANITEGSLLPLIYGRS